MAPFKPPPSGDVVPWIDPMSLSPSGARANVRVGGSSAPEVGAEELDRVGTRGERRGQIDDVPAVLRRHLPDRASLSPDERGTVARSQAGADEGAAVERKRRRAALHP